MSARKYLRDVYPNAHDFDCRCAPHVSWGEFDGVTQQRDKARRALAESEKRVKVLVAALTVYANDSNWHTDDWNVSAVFVGPDGDGYADAPKYARAALLEGEPDAR